LPGGYARATLARTHFGSKGYATTTRAIGAGSAGQALTTEAGRAAALYWQKARKKLSKKNPPKSLPALI
jgi:hypothetical protein